MNQRLNVPFLFAAGCVLVAQAPPVQHSLQDGPYVEWRGNTATLWTLEDGVWKKEQQMGPLKLAVPGKPKLSLTLHAKSPKKAPGQISEPGRFVALSDIHGQLSTSLELLEAHGVINRDGQWTYGNGHLMVVGDLADRGPEVTEGYWFFRALEAQAQKAGGNVHLLLGNHEAMILGQDLRYVHPKYAAQHPGGPAYESQYGQSSELGRWLRSRNVMLKAGRFLFMHGGISKSFLDQGFGLENSNKVFHQFTNWQSKGEGVSEGNRFWLGASGPLWYRGFLLEDHDPLSPQDLERVFKTFNVEHVVVGHTGLDQIRAFHDGKIIGIDAGIQEKRGELLIWENQKLFRGLKNGEKLPLQ